MTYSSINEVRTDFYLIVKERFGKEINELNDDLRYIADLNADSLDSVETIMNIEEKFNINIPDSQAEKLKTIGDTVNYIWNNLNHR